MLGSKPEHNVGRGAATQQAERLSRFLLQAPIRPESLRLAQLAEKQATPAKALRATLLTLLSLPEYKLAQGRSSPCLPLAEGSQRSHSLRLQTS